MLLAFHSGPAMLSTSRTTTTTLLLEGLFDSHNESAWREFHQRYTPTIVSFAQRLGLSADDAADVAQETLSKFLTEYRAGKYDRRRGRLRSWIIGIARWRVADLRRARAGRREIQDDLAVDELPDDESLTQLWEQEHRATLLRNALEELRERSRFGAGTLEAFELYVLEQQPPADVAARLGISVADVYMAKNRVAERLREIITRLEAAYADD